MADRVLYRHVRHPQYAALCLWGIGMSILWPRFVVLASLSLMLILYYFLAGDAEKRMMAQYGSFYEGYMSRTGMFVPRRIEGYFSVGRGALSKNIRRYAAIPSLRILPVMGSGVLLRETTLHSLRLVSEDNVTLVSMLPEDNVLSAHVLEAVTRDNGRTSTFLPGDHDYLGYLMPVDLPQGMTTW